MKLYRLDMDKGPQQGKNLQVQVQQVQLQQKMEDWLREPEAQTRVPKLSSVAEVAHQRQT